MRPPRFFLVSPSRWPAALCKESRRLRSKGRTSKEPFHADTNRTHARRRTRRGRRPHANPRRTGCASRPGGGAAVIDARRPGRTGCHGLQLGHCPRPRRPQRAVAAGYVRLAVHGRRRNRQPVDRPFPFADRAVARQRARTELRDDLLEPDKLLRDTWTRCHAGPAALRERRDARGGSQGALLSYNNAPVWQIGGEIVTGMGADHIKFPSSPATSSRIPR